MRSWCARGLVAAPILAAAVLVLLVGAAAPAAQGGGAGGQAYTPPRTADGQPDLQGIWRVLDPGIAADLEGRSASLGVPAGTSVVEGGTIPYQPAALARRQENFKNSRTTDRLKNADPLAKCYKAGVPRITYLGWPFQIFQTAKHVTILYEWTHVRRQIHLDPNVNLVEGWATWTGTSRGRWDGNTLVVDVTDMNDKTWFDAAGNFHSDALKVTERYTPLDANTLRYEATMEDPKVFTRPWKISLTLHRQTHQPLLEYECHMLLDESGVPLTWPREIN